MGVQNFKHAPKCFNTEAFHIKCCRFWVSKIFSDSTQFSPPTPYCLLQHHWLPHHDQCLICKRKGGRTTSSETPKVPRVRGITSGMCSQLSHILISFCEILAPGRKRVLAHFELCETHLKCYSSPNPTTLAAQHTVVTTRTAGTMHRVQSKCQYCTVLTQIKSWSWHSNCTKMKYL